MSDFYQILGSQEATLLKRENDVYRVGEYFVKLHAKAWAGAVQHEAAAYACIAQNGLAAPEVVLALITSDNSLGRPCLVTRAPCEPPRFTHGDCHAHQMFVAEYGVSGIVDMEVASAGDPSSDLFKFGLEMAALFSPATRWWDPFFAGCGGAPDFETLRQRMLTATDDNYECLGFEKPEERLLHAQDWQDLFALKDAPPARNERS